MGTRRLAAVAVLAVVASTPAAAGAASAGTPITVNQTGPTSLPDTQTPLVGDTTAFVYLRQPTPSWIGSPAPAPELVAMTADGSRDLGPRPSYDRSFSIAGPLLTAARRLHHIQLPYGIDWWNVETGKSGLLPYPDRSHYEYVGAGPGGALFENPNNQDVELATIAGATTDLGQSAGAAATAGPDGLVVTAVGSGNPGATYVPWNDPAHPVSLDIGDVDGSTIPPTCGAVTAAYAACLIYRSTGPAAYQDPTLVPLDGGAPTEAPLSGAGSGCDAGAGIAGGELVYIDTDGCGSSTGPKVGFLAPGSTTPTYATTAGEGAFEGPDGVVVRDPSDPSTTLVATPPSTVSPAISHAASATVVADFVLAGGHVVWTDDGQGDPAPASVNALRTASIAASGKSVEVGPAHTVGTVARKIASDPLRFLAGGPSIVLPSTTSDKIRVARHGRVATYSAKGHAVGVGKRWLVVFHIHRLVAIDLSTHKVHTVDRHASGAIMADGSHVVVSVGRSLRWQSVRTGRSRTVCAKHCGGSVAAAGPWVAFEKHGLTVRNAKTGATPITLTGGQQLVDLSRIGVLTTRRPYPGTYGPVFLRTYEHPGKPRQILTGRPFLSLPQINGGVIAWIDGSADLEALPVSVVVS